MKRLEVNLFQSVLAALVLIVATVSPLSAQRDLPKQARTARATQSPKKTALTSPGGTLTVELQTGRGTLGWTVSRKGHELFTTDGIALLTSAGTLAGDAVPKSVKTRTEHETFSPAVPLKQAVVRNDYTEAVLNYGNFRVELRVMDNAVAHRFVTALGDSIDVTDERFSIHPAYDYTAHLQECRSFVTEYEGPYRHKPYADWLREGNFATVPALLSGDDGTQLLIGESDVDDYPRLFLRADTVLGIHPAFPRSPEEWMPRGDRSEDITREAPYIARTAGTRALPWRYVVVTDARGLIEQTVPVQLARRCALDDTSWIRLGQVS